MNYNIDNICNNEFSLDIKILIASMDESVWINMV